MKIVIDLVPYDIEKSSDSSWRIIGFPIDVRIPDRWAHLADDRMLGPFKAWQDAGMALHLVSENPMKDDEFLEALENAIRGRYDAMAEIGWEALT